MIAVDTNILVYSHRADSPFHAAAVECLDALAASGQAWGVVWQCAHEFLSIVTHPKIYKPPTPIERALAELRNWSACPAFRWIAEGEGHHRTLEKLLMEGKVSGGQIHDARIAAVCLANGVREFWSVDRDFTRFPGFPAVNPLHRSGRRGSTLP